MKKIISAILFTCVLCIASFSQGFTVKKAVGKASYESAPGVWTKLKNGDKISGETNVDIGLHSQIELVGDDGKTYTVKAMKKGALQTLLPKSGGGLQRGSSSVAGQVKADSGASKTVSTSSSRATDLKDDLSWEEPEDEILDF